MSAASGSDRFRFFVLNFQGVLTYAGESWAKRFGVSLSSCIHPRLDIHAQWQQHGKSCYAHIEIHTRLGRHKTGKFSLTLISGLDALVCAKTERESIAFQSFISFHWLTWELLRNIPFFPPSYFPFLSWDSDTDGQFLQGRVLETTI